MVVARSGNGEFCSSQISYQVLVDVLGVDRKEGVCEKSWDYLKTQIEEKCV